MSEQFEPVMLISPDGVECAVGSPAEEINLLARGYSRPGDEKPAEKSTEPEHRVHKAPAQPQKQDPPKTES